MEHSIEGLATARTAVYLRRVLDSCSSGCQPDEPARPPFKRWPAYHGRPLDTCSLTRVHWMAQSSLMKSDDFEKNSAFDNNLTRFSSIFSVIFDLFLALELSIFFFGLNTLLVPEFYVILNLVLQFCFVS
jgi:hypothetical protein